MENEENKAGNVTKNKVISSLIWKFMEVGGTQIVRFVVQIVLARLLCPEDYGIMAILLAFITISDCFVTYGIGTALVQKKDTDDVDYSSIFYMTEFTALVMYLILFFSAPLISKFYHMEILTRILRILATILFFDAVNAVQTAIVQKTMQFKKLFFSNMGAFLVSGIVGVILAFKGFGIWTLVVQQILNVSLITLILWFTVSWRPKFLFSFESVKKLYGFGWKLMLSTLLDVLYKQLYSLTIGRFYSQGQLGEFNKGEQFPYMAEYALDGSIQGVMMPTLSAKNEDPEKIKEILRKTVSTSSYIIMACMFGMAAVSKNLVLVLLSEKWLGCVPFLVLSCFFYCLYPIQTSNQTAINAMGRSDIYLKLEIAKKIVGVIVLFSTIPFGLITMAWGRVASGLFAVIVTIMPNKKLLGYGYKEVFADVFPSLFVGLIMYFFVYLLNFINLSSPFLLLVIQIISGAFVFLLLSIVFKLKPFLLLKTELITKLKRKS